MFNKSKKDVPNITQPRAYQEIGARFSISGWVPKSWLIVDWGNLDTRLSLELIDITGNAFRCESIDVKIYENWFLRFKKNFYFQHIVQFDYINVHFIKKSQGRIVIKIGSFVNNASIFIPLVVKEFEPDGGADDYVLNRHGRMGEIIAQYEVDLQNYYKEMEEIRATSIKGVNVTESDEWLTLVEIEDDDLLRSLLKVLSSSEAELEDQYKIAKQSIAEKNLAKKYKNALDWRGPLCRGAIHRWKGFMFVVYSDDHGRHFHVQHGEKGIDARFSFPEIELIDYKRSRKSISSKEEKQIAEIFKDPVILNKFKLEFDKRS